MYVSELVCAFTHDIEDILPQVQAFVDAINEITDTQFFLYVQERSCGIPKTYDAESLFK